MITGTSQIKNRIWIMSGLLGLLLAASLRACTPGAADTQAEAGTSYPTMLPTSTLAPATAAIQPTGMSIETTTQTAAPSSTPYQTSLEAFGKQYDPDAALNLPPWGSVSLLFWGSNVPVRPVESTPEFVSYPTPQLSPISDDQLIQARCQVVSRWGTAECSKDSPLLRFGCDFIEDPQGIDYGLEPHIPLVAVCEKLTEEHEAAKAGGVHLIGCAFKREIHYIFKIDNEYSLVSDTEGLIDLFAPIDSPDEALSFTQMATGLEARYSFTFDPTLMYFHETIEGTHVTQTGETFEMNLFNFAACSCEPWFNSRINMQVDRTGLITWKDAVPVYMTTGWSCAD